MVVHSSTFAFIESRKARRSTGKNKHTTEFPHVFAHAHNTELSHSKSMCVQKMAKFKYKTICLSLDDTEVSQQMAFISGPLLHRFPIISSKFCKTLQLLRSSTDRHTNKPTTAYARVNKYYPNYKTCTCMYQEKLKYYCTVERLLMDTPYKGHNR